MHCVLAEEILKICRQRELDGDHPTAKQPDPESMERCIMELARQRDELLAKCE